MFRSIPICLLLSAMVAGPAAGRDYTTEMLPESHAIQLESSGVLSTVVTFRTGSFQIQDIQVHGETYGIIHWDGGVRLQETGLPAVPGFRESLVIPDDAAVTATIVASEFVDFPGVRIAPSKGPITRDVMPSDVPWEFGASYEEDAFFPGDLARLRDPYIMRDVRGVVIEVDPFQWNPVTGTLRVYSSITVEVKATGPGHVNVLADRPDKRVEEFEKIYRRHFLNYEEFLRYTPVGETGSMLIITYDAFASSMQPLVDWRNRMGIPTTLVTLSAAGGSASGVQSYVQNFYNTDGMAYLLLVGDGPQMPYLTNGGAAADPRLTLLAGGDNYPDAFVGRISAQNAAQVDLQVQKTVEYESQPDPAGTWYEKATGIASSEGQGYGDNGEADWRHIRNIRTDLLGFTYTHVDEFYDGSRGGGDASGSPSRAMLSSAFNEGRSFINYAGHGTETQWVTSGFSSSNVNALTNHDMLPCIINVGCVNGAFMSMTCFAEVWLRATDSGVPTGGVAMYASTVNQQWATPMRAQDELVDLLVAGAKRTWGGLCFNGSCDMIDSYGSNGISEFKNWHIFGDPALHMRTGAPTALAVSHAGYVDAGLATFEVTTEPGALAAINDNATLLGSAYADGAGLASIPYDSSVIGTLASVELVVTGFNKVPNVSTVDVGSPLTGVSEFPRGAMLAQNLPNPFGPETVISFAMAAEGVASLEILDISGRRVRTLHRGVFSSGTHSLSWDGTDESGHRLAAGSYFYRLTTPLGVETRRMVLLR
ncbi:MAG: C25 family cysteine peptidase [Gemmatimonadota bacterium]|jgi:hypothetical protein|nr:C25 family cysteine peptidase [Gemmatimonadota bacterium]MDP6803423.1 C25 family cysteine peptidase [Gemmatimonadota bacterium]